MTKPRKKVAPERAMVWLNGEVHHAAKVRAAEERVTLRQYVEAGLVDELHFMIGAGVVGEGVRAFETRPPGSLRLLDTRTFDGSSLLLVRYAVER